MKTAKIWTINYRPFVMGGDVHYPIMTEVEIIEEKTINGIDFFSFKTPKGTLYISESQTGAILAKGFEELKENIKGCSKKFLRKQLEDGMKQLKNPQVLSNELFFNSYRY